MYWKSPEIFDLSRIGIVNLFFKNRIGGVELNEEKFKGKAKKSDDNWVQPMAGPLMELYR